MRRPHRNGAARATARQPELKRAMGLWMATALVIGNMVGSGVFLLPSALAGEAGPVSIVALALTGVGAMVLFFRDRFLFTWARFGRDTTIAALAFACSLWAIWGAGQEWIAKNGFVILLLGITVYVWLAWRNSRCEAAEPDGAFALQRAYTPPAKPPVREKQPV